MNAGRPRQFDPDRAVTAAMEQFWAQGYEATSMHSLLAATRLSRSSLYQAFGGKQALFERCLEHYVAERLRAMRRALESSVTGRDFIRDALQHTAEDARSGRPRGCLVMNSAAEFGRGRGRLSAKVNASIEAFAALFAEAVRRGQADGSIRSTRDPALLGRYLVTVMAGLRTLVKGSAADRAMVGQLTETALAVLD